MLPNQTQHSSADTFPVSAGLDLIIALWFFVSPWVYGAYMNRDAWNTWIVGAALAIIAAIRISSNTRAAASFMWVNVVLAAWVFFSPWIYSYTANTGRFVNSLCVGVVMFILSMMASRTQQATVAHRM
ncbi:MAG TPA: SPW repeat protein [Bryobacteraceae bacterium]|nr:SPW repeat protein [Bryobacteraceae bacterium]